MLVKTFRSALLTCIVVWFVAGCDNSTTRSSAPGSAASAAAPDGPQSLPAVKMTIGNAAFTVEVADSEPEMMTGMMFRDSNPADHAMIFVFPDEQPRSFWMKNTRIPLDIIYLDHTGKVVSIRTGQPLDLRGIDSGAPAKYVIEMNLGRAAAIGLKPGVSVAIPEGIREPAK